MANELPSQDIAQHIKKTFDDRKGPTWHCIVGRNFGSFVTHGTDQDDLSASPEHVRSCARRQETRSHQVCWLTLRQKPSTSSTSTSVTAPSCCLRHNRRGRPVQRCRSSADD